jgi:hypothetical protein
MNVNVWSTATAWHKIFFWCDECDLYYLISLSIRVYRVCFIKSPFSVSTIYGLLSLVGLIGEQYFFFLLYLTTSETYKWRASCTLNPPVNSKTPTCSRVRYLKFPVSRQAVGGTFISWRPSPKGVTAACMVFGFLPLIGHSGLVGAGCRS